MTRIVAGEFGGRSISVPANGTRPTSDRVREAIFSKLAHDGVLHGARVLDLFAGSGALGLEAVSRGARQAVLVDSSRGAIKTATANVAALGLAAPRVQVVSDDALRYSAALSRGGGLSGANLRIAPAGDNPELAKAFARQAAARAINLVFLDPPYEYAETDLAQILANLVRCDLMPAGALVVVERSSRSPAPTWPIGLAEVDHKVYGETTVYYAAPTNGVELPPLLDNDEAVTGNQPGMIEFR